ncbi:L-aspartate oxidase [Pelotomaculum terephthalicicum JT]|uniref:L-aspartate oxidase n=1 Tax=Pelotomaculum TaxID=191373 RepID=UPI0009CAD27E|nr:MULTISPECIES: L-aspartate oxidase [Pelotomaculum]MCG9968285.1 L-aspartate oxidase [Pelotomaculum terephthalicicum JT]OPX89510.1 MAG: L-aspartate oxidase [Pelotomaculum sp. PtaB.Bin117]OPY63267.1 MAG: L-aspartate oxidase [Pelotomaculum sp. PtaU1.Bin065]
MPDKYMVNFDSRELLQEEDEYIILGSGIAGLYTALAAYGAGGSVTVLTKYNMMDTSTDKAQGGIAAALGDSDSPSLHREDTIVAGAGLCDDEAVSALVNEGPKRVKELIEMGAIFDYDSHGLALTREGAHSQRRILHASGDATGAEIQRVLTERIREKNIRVRENHFVVDLLVWDNTCYGVLAFDRDNNSLKIYRGKVVVLATGGLGRLFEFNTNPEIATGDGIAIAFRAGAEVMDMEFIQFHPTVLNLPGAPPFLISEAVRGEGAYLRNSDCVRFMPRYHDLLELAPRDIVVRAILKEMVATGANKVYLDLTHLDPEVIKKRFPNITKTCAAYGLDIYVDKIPVAPAAHYMMGGVKTNLVGETSIKGLYACGEVACQGVHGANRLASNSLLDGLVFGGRIVDETRQFLKTYHPRRPEFACDWLLEPLKIDFGELRKKLEVLMGSKVGPVRSGQGLKESLNFFDSWGYLGRHSAENAEQMEVKNMLQVGELVAEAALARRESRGGHYRVDYPDSSRRWQKHIIFRR